MNNHSRERVCEWVKGYKEKEERKGKKGTMNRVLTTHKGFVKIVPDAPAVIAAVMCEIASSWPKKGEKAQKKTKSVFPFELISPFAASSFLNVKRG